MLTPPCENFPKNNRTGNVESNNGSGSVACVSPQDSTLMEPGVPNGNTAAVATKPPNHQNGKSPCNTAVRTANNGIVATRQTEVINTCIGCFLGQQDGVATVTKKTTSVAVEVDVSIC